MHMPFIIVGFRLIGAPGIKHELCSYPAVPPPPFCTLTRCSGAITPDHGHVRRMCIPTLPTTYLKGQCHRIFNFSFFS
jgi:hypothetical protein